MRRAAPLLFAAGCAATTPAPAMRYHCDGVGNCAANPTQGHGTMAKCVAACPKPPGGVFDQKTCTDDKCASCTDNNLPIGQCLGMTGGKGSAIVQSCDDSGVSIKQFTSSDCSGTGTAGTQPVNQCVKATSGGYLENVCTAGARAAGAGRPALAAVAVGNTHDDARAAEVARINAIPGLSWRAGAVERFRGAPIGASKPLLGVKPDHAAHLANAKRLGLVKEVDATEDFVAADSFDSATNWPKCAKVIGDIRDQSNCGCCWAFGAAEAASDRLCIASDGATLVPLSAQDMCFCGSGNGCGGGYVNAAWSRIKQFGLVTGSQQQPDDGKTDPFAGAGLCSPFSLPHCHHHGPTGSDPYPAEGATGCPTESSAKCPTTCDASASDAHSNFTADKWSFTGNVEQYGNEKAIQQAVQTYGPVEVAFTVYDDFENYASGVYKATSSKSVGGHAVKLVGWGVDNGVKYWKIANSWNPYWGENGYFRIVRGTNECGVESQAGANSGSGKWTYGVSPVPPPPADCDKLVQADCGATKGNMMKCMQCITQNMAKYQAAGCDLGALLSFCQ